MATFCKILKGVCIIMISRNGNLNTLEVKEGDAQTLFYMVKNSPYIRDNSDYSKKMESTTLDFSPEYIINAYAMALDDEGTRHKIQLYAGLCNALSVASMMLSEYMLGRQGNNVDRFVNNFKTLGTTLTSIGEFNWKEVVNLLRKQELPLDANTCKEGKGYLAGSLVALIGHEAGHIILSHCIRPDTGDINSRNDERMADLVACAIADTTPFARYSILGGLIMEMIFTWMSTKQPVESETTHPHSRERVYNWVNSNREYLATVGISIKNIDQFLP